MKAFLQHLNIKVIRPEGDNQLLCECPWCNKPKLYVDKTTGLWKCHRNCDSGNLYQLAGKRTDLNAKAINNLLKRSNLTTMAHKSMVMAKPPKIKLNVSDLSPLVGDELIAFCKVKGISPEAYTKLVNPTWRHKVESWAIIPGYNPSAPEKACAAMRVHLKGDLIPVGKDHKKEKYPLVAGSRHGLIGVPWLMKEKPDSIWLCEGWRDACAAIDIGIHATASTGGASTWKDEWLPLFKKKIVFICMDCDKPGVFAAQRAAQRIWTVAKEVRIYTLPYPITDDHGKDLYDHLTRPL